MRVVRVPSDGFELPERSPSEAPRVPADAAPESEPDYALVLVTWHDAWFDFDQQDPDDCRTDYLVRTVGFLVHEGPRFVSVAQEILPDGDGFRAVTHIPRSIIDSITTLSDGERGGGPRNAG
ncbi:MAG: hypothetical protein HY240_04710 [Actinobacteria bacterium]|nr:hypothetical protein [Actinomycetota bacterium]